MSNPISVVGTIATDPKRIETSAGVTLCSFRLASSERRYDREQQKWVDGETNWFGVTAFRTLGDHALESFQKGERVIVNGKLRVRRWEKDERSGTVVEIEADAIGHDVRWGVSTFQKRTSANNMAFTDSTTTDVAATQHEFMPQPGDDYGSEGGDGFVPVAV